jgi:hypothetical protein
MYRCDRRSALVRAGLTTLAGLAALGFASTASAQVQRNFPGNALRGEIAFTDPPDIRLNGQPARLAPGLRLRGPDNLMLVTGAVVGQRFVVHYTVDTVGLVKDVWILRSEEAQGLWPRRADEAASWRFDPIAQTWTKP